MARKSYKQELEDYYGLVLLNVNKFLKSHRSYYKYKDELISEGTVGLSNSIRSYKPQLGASKTYYYSRGIRYSISNYIRKLNEEMKRLVYIDSIPEEILVDQQDDTEYNSTFEVYDKFLPRDPIDRRVYEGILTGSMSYKELGKELKLSQAYLRLRAHRLIKRLRKEMEEMNED